MKNSNLLVHPDPQNQVYHRITTKSAQWNYLNFEAQTLTKNQVWRGNTEENEMVIVLLSGNYKITSNQGEWKTINGRKDVFSGTHC